MLLLIIIYLHLARELVPPKKCHFEFQTLQLVDDDAGSLCLNEASFPQPQDVLVLPRFLPVEEVDCPLGQVLV